MGQRVPPLSQGNRKGHGSPSRRIRACAPARGNPILCVLSNASTPGDAAQGTSLLELCSFRCFQNPHSSLKINISLPYTYILFLSANNTFSLYV